MTGMIIGVLCSILVCWADPVAEYMKYMDLKNESTEGSEVDNKYMHWMIVNYIWKRKKNGFRYSFNAYKFIIMFVVGYAIVELPCWLHGSGVVGIVYSLSAFCLLFLSVVDWKSQYIPLECDLAIGICGLVRLVADQSNWLEYILGLFLVSGFLYVVNKVATPILRRRYEENTIEDVIGDGDMKLMAATGLLLGWKLNFIALGLGCVIGSIIQVILMKVKESDRQFALGPYLSLGVYITMICGEQLVSWYLNIIGFVPM